MSLIDAIVWKWPGARCVVRGDVLERWDGPMAQPSAAEITQAVADYTPAVQLTARCQITSRQKDILAMLATVVRGRNVSAWNAMTTQQKVEATLAEADVWKSIRAFIDDKV